MHGSPCVTADSLILTKGGYKPIIDVQVGDEVLTKSNVWQKVVKKFDNGVHQTCYLDGMGFKNILSERFRPQLEEYLCFLNDNGYKVTMDILNAKDYGMCQNRERIFIIGVKDE